MELFKRNNQARTMNQLFDELVVGGAIVEASVFASAYSRLSKQKVNDLIVYWLVYQKKNVEAFEYIVKNSLNLSDYPLTVALSAIRGAGTIKATDGEQLDAVITFLSQLNLEHIASRHKKHYAPEQFVTFDENVPSALKRATLFITYTQVATIVNLWVMSNTLYETNKQYIANNSPFIQ